MYFVVCFENQIIPQIISFYESRDSDLSQNRKIKEEKMRINKFSHIVHP